MLCICKKVRSQRKVGKRDAQNLHLISIPRHFIPPPLWLNQMSAMSEKPFQYWETSRKWVSRMGQENRERGIRITRQRRRCCLYSTRFSCFTVILAGSCLLMMMTVDLKEAHERERGSKMMICERIASARCVGSAKSMQQLWRRRNGTDCLISFAWKNTISVYDYVSGGERNLHDYLHHPDEWIIICRWNTLF